MATILKEPGIKSSTSAYRVWVIVALLSSIPGYCAVAAETETVAVSIGGGPSGGTFRYFAGAIAEYVSQVYQDIEMFSETSGGSLENVRRLNAGQFDFAIAYAADVFLAAQGKLKEDATRYQDVRPMCYLYGAPAQLVVRADSGIQTVKELAGKKVAVGNPGSGAAMSAERFFRHLGVWNKLRTLYLGYSTAARAFNRGRIDAFWVLVGYPNASVIEAAKNQQISLLSVGREADDSGFYEAYSFYSPTAIPAQTYPGLAQQCLTFQDSALLCVSSRVADDVVYKVLKAIWSPEGAVHLGRAHKAAKTMSPETALTGISVPLAKGAAKFWKEKGLTVPVGIRPE